MDRPVQALDRILRAAAWWIVDLLTVRAIILDLARSLLTIRLLRLRIIIRLLRLRIIIRLLRLRLRIIIRLLRLRLRIIIRLLRLLRVMCTIVRTLTIRSGITLAGIRTDRFTRGGSMW